MNERIKLFTLMAALLMLCATGPALAQASASASASSTGEGFQVTLGEFVVPPGAMLALEFSRSEPCPCQCDPIRVLGWSLFAASDALIQEHVLSEPAPISAWLGQVALVDPVGAPLAPAAYRLRVDTTGGAFRVLLRISSEAPRGAFRISADVCGLSLSVFRMITEAHAEGTVNLRAGEHLMIVLSGNPSTGYEWARALADEDVLLTPIGDPTFVADPAPAGAGGTGGVFIFRFQAHDPGITLLEFRYARPWESTAEEQTFRVSIVVNP